MPDLQNTPLLRQLLAELTQRDAAVHEALQKASDGRPADAPTIAALSWHLGGDSTLLKGLLAEVYFWQRVGLTAARIAHDATTLAGELPYQQSLLVGVLLGMVAANTRPGTKELSLAELYEACK